MPPREDDPLTSTLPGLWKYPTNRDAPLKSGILWLEGKREDDGAEGLWRVHDDLYDVSTFVDKHPGGADWLKLTKGTDITEAFESHHITNHADYTLKKFFVRKATTRRNSPYTFEEDGFYKTLKRRAREILGNDYSGPSSRSILIADFFFITTLLLSVLAAHGGDFLLGSLAGVFLCYTAISAHNFFHQKDNFRMYYFDLSLMSSRDWRISHALSHHLYPNTLLDLEISLFEPVIQWLPTKKSLGYKIISWIYSPIVYSFVFFSQAVIRFLLYLRGHLNHLQWRDATPLILPSLMMVFGRTGVLDTLLMWAWIVLVGSFLLAAIGFNAGHHHPGVFHDGDAPRKDRDWGLGQLDAVKDRKWISANILLVLTNFGNHALHHLFPTVDHDKLYDLKGVFKQTCKEFGVDFELAGVWECIAGQFRQLARDKVNPVPPGVHSTEIRTSISPPSAVWLNTTSALANDATEAVTMFPMTFKKGAGSSLPGLWKYPTYRDSSLKSGLMWIKGKQEDDGAEGLWRIHDDLYDFSTWTEIHPGGTEWLDITKGTDITEAFEAHHVSKIPEAMLKNFHVKAASTRRNSPYTFKEDGFYRTLKRRVREALGKEPKPKVNMSKVYADLLLLVALTTAVLATSWGSFGLATLSGLFLCFTVITAHNFFHQKDNFRMYYFDLCLMSSRDWRISHALSHHLYPNTMLDLEVSMMEPVLQWLPYESKSTLQRYGSWLWSPLIYSSMFHGQLIIRLSLIFHGYLDNVRKSDMIPLILPSLMYFLSGSGLLQTLVTWSWILVSASFFFGLIGINGAHHHPEVFMDGDTPSFHVLTHCHELARLIIQVSSWMKTLKGVFMDGDTQRLIGINGAHHHPDVFVERDTPGEDADWGLGQLDTLRDRPDIQSNLFLALTQFGHHALHHLFPTVDHSRLEKLYPIMMETCKEFGIEYEEKSIWDMLSGQFQQLARTTPNPHPPGYKP
uniref:Cytochrome b5-related protein n=1 Tax=Timema poppense TaxID=170557 RepID=A0A7R9CZ69_TIMPO|nr:unnamed protein product [Timema poppensis]